MNVKELDRKAIEISKEYRRYEKALLEIIIQMEKTKAFFKLGYSSLFSYITERLHLSPAVTYNFIAVARKAIEIPKLKEEVMSGNISICKAKKMTSVLNRENQDKWLNLAKTESHRKLEREVALASPQAAVSEKALYVPSNKEIKEKVKVLEKIPRIQLQLGVSEKIMLNLRRAQDLESQKKKSNTNLEQTLEALLEAYLSKHDPVRKAQRQKVRGKLTSNQETAPSKNNTKGTDENKGLKKTKAHIAPDPSEKLAKKRLFARQEFVYPASGKSHGRVSNKKIIRTPLPRRILHQVQLRDDGRCCYIGDNGKRCTSRRFLEVHHKNPVSLGGSNQLENLLLLCSGHHKAHHLKII